MPDWRVVRLLFAARRRMRRRLLAGAAEGHTGFFKAGMRLVFAVLYLGGILVMLDAGMNEAARGDAGLRLILTTAALLALGVFSFAVVLFERPLAVASHELSLLAALPVTPATYQAYRFLSSVLDPRTVPGFVGFYVVLVGARAGWRLGLPVLALGVALALHLVVAAPALALEAALRRWAGARLRFAFLSTLNIVAGVTIALGTGLLPVYLLDHNRHQIAWLWTPLSTTPFGQAAQLCLKPAGADELFGGLASLLAVALLWACGWVLASTVIHAGALPDAVLWESDQRPPARHRRRPSPRWAWLTPLQRLWMAGPARRTLLPFASASMLGLVLVGLARLAGLASIREAADVLYLAGPFIPALAPMAGALYGMMALGVESFRTPMTLERATPLLLAQPLSLGSVCRQLSGLSAGVHALVLVGIYATVWGIGLGDGPRDLPRLAVQLVAVFALLEGTLAAVLSESRPERWSAERFVPAPRAQNAILLAFTAGGAQSVLAVSILIALTTYAARQDLADNEPWLADPTVRPPARVRLSSALFALQYFFLGQSLVAMAMSTTAVSPLQLVAHSFFWSGLVTSAGIAYWIWRERPEGSPRLGFTSLSSVLREALWRTAPVAAVGCLTLLAATWVPEVMHAAVDRTTSRDDLMALFAMTVVAAPMCEELIFRGLLFRALRRDHGAWPSALLSALVFAVLHPALSFVPVFSLGVATALACESTGALAVPMLIHAFYNLLVIGLQHLG